MSASNSKICTIRKSNLDWAITYLQLLGNEVQSVYFVAYNQTVSPILATNAISDSGTHILLAAFPQAENFIPYFTNPNYTNEEYSASANPFFKRWQIGFSALKAIRDTIALRMTTSLPDPEALVVLWNEAGSNLIDHIDTKLYIDQWTNDPLAWITDPETRKGLSADSFPDPSGDTTAIDVFTGSPNIPGVKKYGTVSRRGISLDSKGFVNLRKYLQEKGLID